MNIEEIAAAAIANERGGRRGMPPITNVLELLPSNLREEVMQDARAAVEAIHRWPPEGCALVAHDTGDGWALMVEDQKHDVIAYLAWPSAWPETMSAVRLREIGFEIV